METIKSFTITRMTLSHFKTFAEETVFDFGALTYVSGDNNLGKSSIADAIAYAFCGVPFWGGKNTERLIGDGYGDMTVTIDFVDGGNIRHVLTRRRYEDKTTIILDGAQARQTDLTRIFAEKDIFLSILNPLYFIEKIAEDGREFLKKLLPMPRHEAVLAELDGDSRKLLENQSLSASSYFIQQRRKAIRELADKNTYLSGQMDLLARQQAENATKSNQSATRLKTVEQRLSEIYILRRQSFSEMSEPYSGEEAILAIRQGLIEKLDPAADKVVTLKRQEIEIAFEEAANREYVSKYADELTRMNGEVQRLYDEHKRLSAALKNAQTGSRCATCMMTLTEDNIQNYQSGLQNRLAKITERGKTHKAQIAELQALDKQSEETFLRYQEADCTRLRNEHIKLPSTVAEKIQGIDLTLRYGMLDTLLCTELDALESERTELSDAGQSRESVEKLESETAILQKAISDNDSASRNLQNLVTAAAAYAAKQAELTLAPLTMDKADIKLMDIVRSTGEIKNVFRFTYGGRDYRLLSASEKVRAGLEVAELLKKLTNRNYPVFIDNAESVTTMTRPSGQTILATVKKGAALTVSAKAQSVKPAHTKDSDDNKQNIDGKNAA
jgi:chromosome segregation ATPase